MINCSGTEAGGILDSDKTKGSEQIQNKTILALGEGVCLQMKKKRFKKVKSLSCVSTSGLNSELHMSGSDPKPHSKDFEN